MLPTRSALVVDDERDIRELLSITLTRMGLRVDTAEDLASAQRRLAAQGYDLCFTDMRLPDGSGHDLIELISSRYPDTPVAMITAHGNVDAAVNALKAGAFDFVSKPVDLHVLRRMVQNALQLSEQRRAQVQLSNNKLLGESPPIHVLRATIAKVARSQAPVFISGESGVGKELVARLIHEQGPRADGAFVPVNCGAIPTELMESEFFGHKKGSFSGAVVDKEGLFQAAHGGTLFLDEVAELPLHMQVKLLRAIQEKSVRPVGANVEQPVDVRILSATHTDLAARVAEGRFRHDLYYRINVIELKVPPLRERQQDIPLLADALLRRLARENGDPGYQLADDARQALVDYAFPGNVRELENIVERAVALCDAGIIHADDLRLPARAPAAGADLHSDPGPASAASTAAPARTLPETQRTPWPPQPAPPAHPASNPAASTPHEAGQPTPQAPAAHAHPAAHTPPPGNTPTDLPDLIESLEREAIQKALAECRYNKTKAAAQLGITFRAMRYKLKKLGID